MEPERCVAELTLELECSVVEYGGLAFFHSLCSGLVISGWLLGLFGLVVGIWRFGALGWKGGGKEEEKVWEMDR